MLVTRERQTEVGDEGREMRSLSEGWDGKEREENGKELGGSAP